MIYSIKLNCPVCSNKFTNMKAMESKLRIENTDTDFFTKYRGDMHPLLYNAIVCPNCGNSALEENFRQITTRRKKIIKEKVSFNWVKQDYTGERTIEESIICYKLALYCAQVEGSKKAELAGICLKIAWLYRIKEDERENEFLESAARLYEKSYKEEYSKMDELTLIYLIGELSRRIGDMDKAISWIGNVVSNPYIKNNPQIEKLARDQWGILKEYRKTEK